MRKIFSLLLLCLWASALWAQSGEGYDPESPGDPNVFYTLRTEASPLSGGSTSPSGAQVLVAGQSVSVNASARLGYDFKRWMMGDSVVSTNRSFYFTMPASDVVLTAYFEWNPAYDPESPGDPSPDGYLHRVYAYASPSAGGYFNSSSFTLLEGKTTNLYAYPRSGYRFEAWLCNGEVVSTENPLTVRMGTADIAYTATFVYEPTSPGEPSPNLFNATTGETVIDNFTPGSLNRALSEIVGSDNYALVQSVTVIGRMESSDFGFARYFPNCGLIDLSRTTGYTEVPNWAFESAEALTKLMLPASTTRCGYNAFNGCANLAELYCYATTPPETYSNTFAGVDASLVVKVPSEAVALYQKADGWKDFTILPVDEETCNLEVQLPADAADGRYRNMYIELQNAISQQTYRFLITGRTAYTFGNLIRHTSYNLAVKNAAGTSLGEIAAIAIGEKDTTIAFASLLQPQTLSARLATPDGTEVTPQAVITWLNTDGSLLAQGATAGGIVEGSTVRCRISMNEALSLLYEAPGDTTYTVGREGNVLTYTLRELREVTLSGRIVDSATDQPLAGANILLTQVLNGKYTKSATARTGSDGTFSLNAVDGPGSMTVSADNYVSQTKEFAAPGQSPQLGDVALRSITGAVVQLRFTYQESVEAGQTATVQEGYADDANVTYRIENLTQGTSLTDFSVQNGTIVLTKGTDKGDELSLSVISPSGKFMPVTAHAVIDGQNRAVATFAIVELGGLQASVAESEAGNLVGILYDGNGVWMRKTAYTGQSLRLSDLPDGNYSLVTMGSSRFFNTVLNLAELSRAGLREGSDYVRHNITVSSGTIASLQIDAVPRFDESKFYYTGAGTSFTANKSQVTIGNYITLRAKVDFKEEYAASVRNLKLIVDLPESCSFVENSVLTGSGLSPYEVAENRITVSLDRVDEAVRFCIIPTVGETCKPNAFVQFSYGGESILQPIGAAYFEAENLAISVPKKTADTLIVVSGNAQSDCIVKVYDGNIPVGQTRSMANGRWSTKVSLYKPYSRSYHRLHATVETAGGQTLQTDTKLLEFDKNMPYPKAITMIYGGTSIVFDQIEGTSSTNTYSYVPGNTAFTFLAQFTKNDTALIKNPVFKILASDGTVRQLAGTYSAKHNAWVATTSYGNSNRLPINVTVEYDKISSSPLYDAEADADFERITEEMLAEIDSAYKDCAVKVLHEDADSVVWEATTNGYNTKEYFRLSLADYQQTVAAYTNDVYCHIKNDTTDLGFVVIEKAEKECDLVVWDNLTRQAFHIAYYAQRNPMPSVQSRIVPLILSTAYGVGSTIFEYHLKIQEIDSWYMTLDSERSQRRRDYARMLKALYDTCDDGNYKIKNAEVLALMEQKAEGWWNDAEDYFLTFDKAIAYDKRNLEQTCLMKGIANVSISVAGAMISGATSLIGQMAGWINNTMRSLLAQSANTAMMEAGGQLISLAVGENYERNKPKAIISEWYHKHSNELVSDYISIIGDIKAAYSPCEKDDEDDEEDDNENPDRDNDGSDDDAPDFRTPPLSPSIDPAGYVYEGVSSNRLQGVTATAYYMEQTEDMYGVIHEEPKLWDAAEYAQENPLFTDAEGRYRWDVPQGLWQVKFEKEGYETTYSDWLPVPPPQLEVNIGMTQNRQPEVKQVRAYQGGIEVDFDKYMLPDLLNGENVLVIQDEQYVEGEVVMLDEETAYADESVKYASKVRFVPASPFTAEEVTLIVSNRVRSYAGLAMAETFRQTFDIELEMTGIEVDSVADVAYEGESVLTVTVVPASVSAGKTLRVTPASGLIASTDMESYTLDEDGKAVITVSGELPGATTLAYAIEGYDLTAQTRVNVSIVRNNVCGAPMATVASGTAVEKGTAVVLLSATEGATIYYTTDGSCPCEETESRKVYDGTPILIYEDVTIRAMAVAPDMYDSEVVEFRYTIDNTSGIGSIKTDSEITIYPLPVRDVVTVSANGKLIRNVTVCALNGMQVAASDEASKAVTLRVGNLPHGIYIIYVYTEKGAYSRKILKI